MVPSMLLDTCESIRLPRTEQIMVSGGPFPATAGVTYALGPVGDNRDHGHLQLTCSAAEQHLE